MRNYGAPAGAPFRSSFMPSGDKQLDALVHAIECADASAAILAMQSGANPNSDIEQIGASRFPSPLAKNLTPMRYACVVGLPHSKQKSMIEALAKFGGSPGNGLHTQAGLSISCHHDDQSLVARMIAWGATVDGVGLYGTSFPLIEALKAGAFDCAELLIKAGAQVDYLPNDHRHEGKLCSRGKTALVYFCEDRQKDWTKQVEFLLEHGADPAMSVKFIGSPLELAISHGVQRLPMCLRLIKDGADPCAKGKGGVHLKEMLENIRHAAELQGASKEDLAILDGALSAKPKLKSKRKSATATDHTTGSVKENEEIQRRGRVRNILGF